MRGLKDLKLYLTRHGQTLWNIEGRFQGWDDSPLSEKGKSNALALKERLKDTDFFEVYSSPAGRAITTAQIVSDFEIDRIILDKNLREINLGSWQGRLVKEVETEYPKEYSAFWFSPHLYKREGSETYYDVQKRALVTINSIIKKYFDTDINILLVTHAITLKTIMAHFENRGFERLWDPPFLYDTCLNIIEIKDGKNNIILHGDVTHITNIEDYEFLSKVHLLDREK